MMVVFPSWVNHWVHPFLGEDARVMIAFKVLAGSISELPKGVRSGARQQAGPPEFSALRRYFREIPRTKGGRGVASDPPLTNGGVGGSRFHGSDEGFRSLGGIWTILREAIILPFSSIWMMIQRLKPL